MERSPPKRGLVHRLRGRVQGRGRNERGSKLPVRSNVRKMIVVVVVGGVVVVGVVVVGAVVVVGGVVVGVVGGVGVAVVFVGVFGVGVAGGWCC